MLLYIIRRSAFAVFVVWAAYTITFALLYLLPADPVSIMLSGASDSSAGATDADRAVLAAKYGFDQPVVVQYATLLWGALHGDLGTSIQSGKPVVDEIGAVLPQTLQLAAVGFAFGIVIGVVIAILANLTTTRAASQFFFSIPPFLASIPTFLIALVLIQVFAFGLGWFPSRGTDGFSALILPGLTIGLAVSAAIAQVLGKGIQTALREPFVDVLRTKGVSRWGIQFGHVLKNAAIPALTIVALVFGGIFAGAVITETVFSRAGLGRLLQSSVNAQDIPVVQAIVIIAAIAYAGVNLAVDLLYPLVDPRIRRVAVTA